jgi:hypothetical protein
MNTIEHIIEEARANAEPGSRVDYETVIWRHWPATQGGIGFAHSKARAEARQAIRDFYAPRDYSPEPTYGGQCG